MIDQAIAPIDPSTGQPTPVTTPSPTPPAVTQQGTSEVLAPPPVVDVASVEIVEGKSPITAQRRDPRGSQPDYDPIQLILLTGAHKGKSVDLGIGINELSTSQNAAWESRDADGIRVGANFKNISPREFSLSLEYFDLGHDILHLTENIAHLQEITGEDRTPPMLMLVHGSKNIGPVVCTSISTQLSEPHSERRGFHYAKIELSLALYGGAESPHALGAPLVATPLGDERATETDAERQQQGQTAAVELLLADCLGPDGSAEVADLLEQGVTAESVAGLSPNALVQSAIAGIIPPATLADPTVASKLAGDLAAVMALNENGVGTANAQLFAEAVLSGDTSTLPADLVDQAIATRDDYTVALEAIAAGDLTPILEPGQRVGEKIRGFGSCGLTLKATGITATTTGGTEPTTLGWINDWAATATDEEIAATLGDVIAPARLRNGLPYQSQGEFISFHTDPADGAASGVAVWQRATVAAGSGDGVNGDGDRETPPGGGATG